MLPEITTCVALYLRQSSVQFILRNFGWCRLSWCAHIVRRIVKLKSQILTMVDLKALRRYTVHDRLFVDSRFICVEQSWTPFTIAKIVLNYDTSSSNEFNVVTCIVVCYEAPKKQQIRHDMTLTHTHNNLRKLK